jgi:hypothetical protein
MRATTGSMALAMGTMAAAMGIDTSLTMAVAMGIVAMDGTVAATGVLGDKAAHRLLALLNTFHSRVSVTQGPRSFF